MMACQVFIESYEGENRILSILVRSTVAAAYEARGAVYFVAPLEKLLSLNGLVRRLDVWQQF